MAKAIFHPQIWVQDTTMEVDALGETTWEVGSVPADWEDDSYESDCLRDHDNAPQWVKDWAGPFWVEIVRSPEEEDGTSGQDRDSYSDTQDRDNYTAE